MKQKRQSTAKVIKIDAYFSQYMTIRLLVGTKLIRKETDILPYVGDAQGGLFEGSVNSVQLEYEYKVWLYGEGDIS